MSTNHETDDLETATSLIETLTAWAATNLDRAMTHDQGDVDQWEEQVRHYETLAVEVSAMTPAQIRSTISDLTPRARQATTGPS